jgi:acetoin utilization protein AcuB
MKGDKLTLSDYRDITIEEFTSPCPISVDEICNITEVMELMKEHQVRHIPVVKNKKVVGIIADRDTKVFANPHFAEKFSASDVMVEDPFMVSPSDTLENVVFQMSKMKIGSAVVVNDNKELVGIFTSIDALNALVEVLRGEIL